MYIYIHVPFCRSRCIYCDFYVVLEKYGGQDAYVGALLREVDQRFSASDNFLSPVKTIYVGGGTPSLLSASAYQQLFGRIQEYVPIVDNAEITLEANPQAMADDPAAYLDAGFNRLSVGVQSFNDQELKRLSRIHTAAEAEQFIQEMRRAGFSTISLDLMYGLPGQTLQSWQETLDRAVALGVEHISMYGLKVEENTPLARLSRFDRYQPPDEDANVAMYFEALGRLQATGFRRYEFSNLARPGYESRHNLNYWDNGKFMALGVSAHGYWQGERYETVRDLGAYLANPTCGERHVCSRAEQLENALIFGLRKAEGVDIAALEEQYGIDFEQRFRPVLDKYIPDGFLLYETGNGKRLMLSEKAIPVSNAILAEFLSD